MILAEETITVFNKAVDYDGYDEYYPTVIEGVSWYSHVVSSVTQDGLFAANQYTIRVPIDAKFSGKEYCLPYEFAEADDRSGIFTFAQGDVIVHAGIDEPMTPAELLNRFGEIVTIVGVTDDRRAPREKHWKIVGK